MKRIIFILLLIIFPFAFSSCNEETPTPQETVELVKIDCLDEQNNEINEIKYVIGQTNYVYENVHVYAYFSDGNFDELSFKMNRVRLEIYGRLNSHLSYHFRQSFNKYSNPYAVDNMSSSIEYANIKWTQSDRFELVAGKQCLAVGGYESYVNGLKVREFSEFNNNFEIFGEENSISCFLVALFFLYKTNL